MTRAHGLHTHLLTRSDYQAILKARDAKAVSDYLMKGDYAQLLEKTSAEYPNALHLARVFRSLLVSRCYHLVEIAPGRCRTFLEAYLVRFQVENMKRVLRAKHAEKPADRASLIPIPKGYDDVNLQAMIDAATLQDAVGTLAGTRFGGVAEVMPIYDKYRFVSVLEASLEKTYFDSVVRPALKRVPSQRRVRGIVGAEADLLNIRMLADLRARKVAVDAVRTLSFTPVGLTPKELLLLSAATPDSMPPIISKTEYSALAQPVQDALESGKDESLDHVARLEIYKRARSVMMPYSDTFAYVLGYVIEAETETNNLISMVTGKELGLAESRIQAAVCI